MSYLIDSHCHLDMLNLDAYQGDLNAAIQAANAVGVNYFLSPGVTLEQSAKQALLLKDFSNVVLGVAMHPSEEIEYNVTEDELIDLGSNPQVVAIGETGLDYYYAENESLLPAMRDRFRVHIRAALKLKKPLIIHSRDAGDDLINILKEENAGKVGGVLHCFTDTWQIAKQALDLGFYIGFTGIITFKKADKLREVVRKVPLDRMLIETDAPYLAPEPFRGKPNEPKYLPYTAHKLAELTNLDFAQICKTTRDNFRRLFGFGE